MALSNLPSVNKIKRSLGLSKLKPNISGPLDRPVTKFLYNTLAPLEKVQGFLENPGSRIKLPTSPFSNSNPLGTLYNLGKGFGEGVINESVKVGGDVGRTLGILGRRVVGADTSKINTDPASYSGRLSQNIGDYFRGVNPVSTFGNYGAGRWNVPLTNVRFPELGISEAPITQTAVLGMGAAEPILTALGGKNLKAVAGLLTFGGGVNTLLGDKKKGIAERFFEGTNTVAPTAFTSSGYLKATNPLVDGAIRNPLLRYPLKSVANVLQGVGQDKVVGQNTSGLSITIDALFPVASDLASKSFKSSNEAIKAVEAKLIQAFGGSLRNNKGLYTTADKFVKGTRAYRKSGRYMNGAVLGFEPYQEEDGKWKVRFNRERALLGLGATIGINKGGDLSERALKEADLLNETKEVINNQKLDRTGLPRQLEQQGLAKQVDQLGAELRQGQYPEEAFLQGTKQTLQKELGLNQPKDKARESLENMIQKLPIPVNKKINVLDYLRTPPKVLEKIGLDKQAKDLERANNAYLDELPKEINKITEWYKRVPDPQSAVNIFRQLDGKNVVLTPAETQVAKEIREYLVGWADRLKLPKESRITNYITHIFDDQLIKKEFDDDLAKIIQDQVAGSVYDPFTLQRLGALGYKENVWDALDAYVKRGVRKANMDDALEGLKSASDNLELSQFNYVKRYADRINMRPTEIDNLLDNLMKSSPLGYRLGARPTARISKFARQMVYRGTLGLNVGSALRNLTQGVNTYATLGEKYTALGYINLLKRGTSELDEVGVLKNDIIDDRSLNATKKFWENTDKVLFSFFEIAEKINRGSAYYGAKAKGLAQGMSEQQAREYAVAVVKKTQFTFGKIDTPVALQSDIAKLLLQFQSYNVKQLEFLGQMAKSKDVAGMARYTIGSIVMLATIGDLLGMDWKDLIPSVKIGASPVFSGSRDVIKSITGGQDKYGNELDIQDRMRLAKSAVVPFIPAGVQGKKTIGGLTDFSRGYTQTTGGRVKSPIEQTPSNAIRSALFGSYTLPEVKSNKDNSPLGEKQSEVFKKLGNAKDYYNEVMSERSKNKKSNGTNDAIDNDAVDKEVIKFKLQKSKDPYTIKQDKVYYLENDSLKSISTDLTPQKLDLTGEPLIDKQLLSEYKSTNTKKINDVMKLFKLGVLSKEDAVSAISELKGFRKLLDSASKGADYKSGAKKGKKLSIPQIKLGDLAVRQTQTPRMSYFDNIGSIYNELETFKPIKARML